MQNSVLAFVLQKRASVAGTYSERLAREAVEYSQIDLRSDL